MSSNVSCLDGEQNAAAVKNFKEIVGTCIGPRGWLKAFQTVQGGFAMISTTSSRIFNSLSIQRPILQILMAGLKSHAQIYGDGGLFLAHLATSVYLEHVETKIPRQLCIRINDYVCQKALELLNENKSSLRLDVGKLSDMSIPVKSILTSKPLCQLSLQEVNHLSVLIIKAFYSSLSPGNIKDAGINIISCEGPSVMQSVLMKGILLPVPFLDVHSSRIIPTLEGKIKVALCTMSLAGHQIVFSDKTVIDERGTDSLNTVMSAELLRFCNLIIQSGTKVLLCQKVVHPSIRKYLNKNGLFVSDRLGIQPIKSLCSKLKLRPIQSLSVEITPSDFGEAEDVEMLEMHGKRYLALRPLPEHSETYTMMLCANEESQLDELKICVQAAEKTLFHLIKDPRVLCGAGCFEIQMAKFIRCLSDSESINTEPGLQYAAKAKIHTAVNNIANSFESIAKSIQQDLGDYYRDTSFNHFWCFPKDTDPEMFANKNLTCCCGFISYKTGLKFCSLMFRGLNEATDQPIQNEANCSRDLPDIADSLVTKREAIATAFELCNVILRINATLEG